MLRRIGLIRCAALAAAVLFMTASTVAALSPDGSTGVATAGYLLLPISCGVLAVVGGVLTPPPTPAPRPSPTNGLMA